MQSIQDLDPLTRLRSIEQIMTINIDFQIYLYSFSELTLCTHGKVSELLIQVFKCDLKVIKLIGL